MQRPDPPEPNPASSVGGAHRHRPLRVLVPGVSWPLETFVDRLLVGLAAQGMDLTLAPLWSFARPPSEWTERHAITWADDLVRWTPRAAARVMVGRNSGAVRDVLRPRRLIPGGPRARERLLGAGWDVVYAPWINALTDAEGVFSALRAPVVTSCRGALISIAPWDPTRTGYTDALRRVFGRSHLVHCVSAAIADDAVEIGLAPDKVRIVRPAVDPGDFHPANRDPIGSRAVRVIGVGSLIWRKDFEHALRAVRTAVDRGADLRLDIVGEGPDRQRLMFTIGDLGLETRVRLLGKLDSVEVSRCLRDADIFLHSSSSEGISNSVLEAMASGLPVVSTEAGGMREAVRDAREGFVVGVRDVGSTASALVSLAANPSLRARMGAAGRGRVEAEFRLDAQIASFSDLLHEAAGR